MMRYIQLFIGKYADLFIIYYEGCYTEFILGVILGNWDLSHWQGGILSLTMGKNVKNGNYG